MDITQTTIPKSDQQNYDDYLNGVTRTVTISKVSAGSAEQPVDIHLEEFPGRAYRPSKSMRRVLVSAWGPETSVYVGRKMTLYGDPNVKFGGVALGGIKISHLSHIDKPLKIALTVTRGKREPFIVSPLTAPTNKFDATRDERTEIKAAGGNFGPGVGDIVSEKQTSEIGRLFGKLGMNEPAIQLSYVSDVIERVITSPSQLTSYEASRVIRYLKKDEDRAALAEEAGGAE